MWTLRFLERYYRHVTCQRRHNVLQPCYRVGLNGKHFGMRQTMCLGMPHTMVHVLRHVLPGIAISMSWLIYNVTVHR